MQAHAQFVAARLTRGTSPSAPSSITPCVKILRGIDAASRAGANFQITIVIAYTSAAVVHTETFTSTVLASTYVQDFDGLTGLIRPADLTLTATPDANTLLVATAKIAYVNSAGQATDLSEVHASTYPV